MSQLSSKKFSQSLLKASKLLKTNGVALGALVFILFGVAAATLGVLQTNQDVRRQAQVYCSGDNECAPGSSACCAGLTASYDGSCAPSSIRCRAVIVAPTKTPAPSSTNQCYFGYSSCSNIGRYSATGCSSCPSGSAVCCGERIESVIPTSVPEIVATATPNPNQCYFGVSSCSTLGRYQGAGCGNCPDGVAACCGSKIPVASQVCTPNSSICANNIVRVCNGYGTSWQDKACANGTACQGDRCVAPVTPPTAGDSCSQPHGTNISGNLYCCDFKVKDGDCIAAIDTHDTTPLSDGTWCFWTAFGGGSCNNCISGTTHKNADGSRDLCGPQPPIVVTPPVAAGEQCQTQTVPLGVWGGCKCESTGLVIQAGKLCPKAPPAPVAGQCYFGVSTCGDLDRVSADTCGSCPGGVAVCCGDRIPDAAKICTPGVSKCTLNGIISSVEVCNSTGTDWDTAYCTSTQVCDESGTRCVAKDATDAAAAPESQSPSIGKGVVCNSSSGCTCHDPTTLEVPTQIGKNDVCLGTTASASGATCSGQCANSCFDIGEQPAIGTCAAGTGTVCCTRTKTGNETAQQATCITLYNQSKAILPECRNILLAAGLIRSTDQVTVSAVAGQQAAGIVNGLYNSPVFGPGRIGNALNIAANGNLNPGGNLLAGLYYYSGVNDVVDSSNRLYYQTGLTPEEAAAYRNNPLLRVGDAVNVGGFAVGTAESAIYKFGGKSFSYYLNQGEQQLNGAVNDITSQQVWGVDEVTGAPCVLGASTESSNEGQVLGCKTVYGVTNKVTAFQLFNELQNGNNNTMIISLANSELDPNAGAIRLTSGLYQNYLERNVPNTGTVKLVNSLDAAIEKAASYAEQNPNAAPFGNIIINSHGTANGIIDEAGNLVSSTDIANAVTQIQGANGLNAPITNCNIILIGCNTSQVAKGVAQELADSGAQQVIVTGAEGYVTTKFQGLTPIIYTTPNYIPKNLSKSALIRKIYGDTATVTTYMLSP